MQIAHQPGPDRRRAADAADPVHGRATGIADPDPHRVTITETQAPVVAHVLAGACFHGRPEAGGQHAVGAEGAGAGVAV